MLRRETAIEVFAPTEGIHTELSPSMITPRSSPRVHDCNAYYGVVQKDYGTTLFATGTLGAVPNFIYEAPFAGNTTLEVFTNTGMFKHASGTYANDGQVYTGTVTDYWHACMHNDAFIFTNGVNLVQYKASYNATGTVMGGVASGSYKAFAVVSFKDHLNLYHTVEGGSENAKRVRWSKTGTLAYATSDWSTGTANFLDIQDAEGDILAAEKLGGGSVAVYAEGSIHIQEWVGGTDVYRFTKMLSNINIPSKRCIVANNDIHFVATRDGVYEYRGGRDFTKISKPIEADWLGLINDSNANTVFMQFIREDSELRVYVPEGTSTQPNKCYICKIDDGYSWFKDNRNATCQGRTVRGSAITIGNLVGNIGAQNWLFGEYVVRAEAPIYLVGDESGRVNKMDQTVYSVMSSGTAVPQAFSYETKDISSIRDIDPLVRNKYNLTMYADDVSRWTGVDVELKGSGSIGMQYSTDGGSNWTVAPEGSKTLSTTWDMYTWDLDIDSPLIRFKLINTATNEAVYMRYWKVRFVPGIGQRVA